MSRGGIPLRINGVRRQIAADPATPLLWALRDGLGLKGTKYGCGVGVCGACTVLIDDEANHACMVTLEEAANRAVTTIEGLAEDPRQPLLQAWAARQVPQCGYCQPAQLMAAESLLRGEQTPSEAATAAAMDAVLCRCGTYQRIREALRAVVAGAEAPFQADVIAPPAELAEDEPQGELLDQWIRIRPDNTAVLMINRSEMGQGTSASLATLLAEELEMELAQIRAAPAPADPKYANPFFGEQLTGGSTGIRAEWERLRLAGAAARERLVEAAMREWKASRSDCRAEKGTVVHVPSGRTLSYAELVATAREVPAPKRVELKPPDEFRLIGRPILRPDVPLMITGRAGYGIDIERPGMVVALLARPPKLGARAACFDASKALAVPGVVDVREIASGVAVAAKSFWAAWRGREALSVEWTAGTNGELSTEAIYRELEAALGQPGDVARTAGAPERMIEHAEQVVEARYRTPYLAHCTIEPPNCVADVRDGACDVWVGTQDQSATQALAGRLTGLPRRNVRVHTTFLGGGFGRRLETDFVAEAVELSRQLARPVQVLWTREDDLQHDFFRPAHCASLRAAIDADGKLLAWWQRIAGPSLAFGMNSVPYPVPNLHEERVTVESPLPIGSWRGVGAVQNTFVIESFVDELAAKAARDPLEYRLELLADSARHVAVLELAADKAQWGQALAPGRARGVAVFHGFGSWVAQIAEVSASGREGIRVHRVTCAVDCGQTVNPDTVRAQLEGGIAIGLSAALKEEIEIEAGSIRQTNLSDYPILKYSEMPEIDVHFVVSDQAPGGIGEPGVPVIAPAVANAVFAATGRRLRTLPLRLGPDERRPSPQD